MWQIRVFSAFCPDIKLPITVYCDNQGAQYISKNNSVSPKTKHIQISHLFVRECVEKGVVEVTYLPSEDMPADLFTKPLSRVKVEHLRPCLGITRQSKWVLFTMVHSS